MRVLLLLIIAVGTTAFATAQTEIGSSDDTPSSTWSLLSLQRTWIPQRNGFPNWGFGAQGFTSIDKDRRYYIGFGILGSGIERRDAVALVFGPGVFILGDRNLGMFALLQGGLVISSRSGATGFNLFGDASMEFGAGAVSALGGCVQISSSLRLQAALVANVYSVDGGVTPYGLQIGITSGGR